MARDFFVFHALVNKKSTPFFVTRLGPYHAFDLRFSFHVVVATMKADASPKITEVVGDLKAWVTKSITENVASEMLARTHLDF